MKAKQNQYEIKTKSGIRLDICASWLQKAIRRGKEKDALWIAEELFQSGFERYLLYRLWVIAYEDIGAANLPLVQLASSTYQTWLLHRKERGKDFVLSGENRVFNGLLVCLLSRSRKNRLADDCTQVILAEKTAGWIPDMNTLAVIDEHVMAGKEAGYKYRHWVEIGSKCANLVDDSFIGGETYKAQAEAVWRAMADQHGEPQLPTDSEIEALGLK